MLDRKYVGTFDGKIVGVNNYRGHVNNREMVRVRKQASCVRTAVRLRAETKLTFDIEHINILATS